MHSNIVVVSVTCSTGPALFPGWCLSFGLCVVHPAIPQASIPPPPVDERLAWLSSRHPVVRRLVLRYILFAVRGTDFLRVKQLLSVIWYVDTSKQTEESVEAATAAATRLAEAVTLENATQQKLQKLQSKKEEDESEEIKVLQSALKAAKQDVASALAAVPYSRPADLQVALMSDIVLHRSFFEDLAKEAGLLAGSRDDTSAAVVLLVR